MFVKISVFILYFQIKIMSANASSNKLIKASTEASEKGVQHILAIVKQDGTFAMSGSDNMVHAILNNPTLHAALRNTITNNTLEEGIIFPLNVINYPLLPCAPGSKDWKGSARIRKVLDNMVTTAGYGKYGKKLGQGLPPIGWPDDIPWVGYKGAANSRLTITGMTRIIVSMLEAAQLDPATHVTTDDPPLNMENQENNDEVNVNQDEENIANEEILVGNNGNNMEQDEVPVDIVEYQHDVLVPLAATDGEPEMPDEQFDFNFNDMGDGNKNRENPRDDDTVEEEDEHRVKGRDAKRVEGSDEDSVEGRHEGNVGGVGGRHEDPVEGKHEGSVGGRHEVGVEGRDEETFDGKDKDSGTERDVDVGDIGEEQSKEKYDTSAKKKRYV